MASFIEFYCSVENESELLLPDTCICFSVGNEEVPAIIEAEMITMKTQEIRKISIEGCDREIIVSYFHIPLIDDKSGCFWITLKYIGQWNSPSTIAEIDKYMMQCELSKEEILLARNAYNSDETWDITHCGRIIAEHSILNDIHSLIGENIATFECKLGKSRSLAAVSYAVENGHKTFVLPFWQSTQRKETFLPDLYKAAAFANCRLIVLLEGEHIWPTDLISPANPGDLTLNDVALNVTVESECSDTNRLCVLTWCRFFGAQVHCDETSREALNWGREFEDGFRCALLRIEGWELGAAPSSKLWSVIDALTERACGEISAAYGEVRVLLVDKSHPLVGEANDGTWGVGDRAATFIGANVLLDFLSLAEPVLPEEEEAVRSEASQSVLSEEIKTLASPSSEDRGPNVEVAPRYAQESSEVDISNSEVHESPTQLITAAEQAGSVLDASLLAQRRAAADRLQTRLAARKNKRQPTNSSSSDVEVCSEKDGNTTDLLPSPALRSSSPASLTHIQPPYSSPVQSYRQSDCNGASTPGASVLAPISPNSSVGSSICVPKVVLSLGQTCSRLKVTSAQYHMLYQLVVARTWRLHGQRKEHTTYSTAS